MSEYLNSFPGKLVQWVLEEIAKLDYAETAWQAMPEDARRERLDQMATRGEHLAQQLIDVVVADGRHVVMGTVESVTFKKGVKVVVQCSKSDEHILNLAQNAGGPVQLMIPQLAFELDASEVDLAAQEALNLGGVKGWVPPADTGDDDD